MEPLYEFVPEVIETPRLILRSPRASDGAAINAAVIESLEALRPYMPWAQTAPTLAQSEAECRRMQAKVLLREDLPLMMFERAADGSELGFIGGSGLHRIDWTVRRFEVGYWCRSSRVGEGFVAEAIEAITRCAFEEVRMDDANTRSWRVAERAGFTLEGVLRSQSLNPAGEARDTRVYAKTRAVASA